ncbi:MAG: tetratricopeptide repeat protein [Candidatus Obscuribacterales bacterium]|nr:tetratricopeptide repeat protein [Candidatus Obscuribacterales bacterium]
MDAGEKENTWEELFEAGQQHYINGQLAEAEQLFMTALVAAKRVRQGISDGIALIYSRLGDLCSERHEFQKAENFYRNALVEYENMQGDRAVDICISLKRISEVCRIQSKNRQASNLAGRSRRLLDAKIKTLEKTFQSNWEESA